MKQMAAPRTSKLKEQNNEVRVRFQLHSGDSTASYYCNFAEVTNTPYDFSVSFGKIPTKLKQEDRLAAESKQPIPLEAFVQIQLPVTLIPGLIRALNAQKEKFENQFGKIKEVG